MDNLVCYKVNNPMMGGNLYELSFENGHCVAIVARGKGWLTVYSIETEYEYRKKGECQRLLKRLKEDSGKYNLKFGLWCPMNKTIEHICEKLGIEMYR